MIKFAVSSWFGHIYCSVFVCLFFFVVNKSICRVNQFIWFYMIVTSAFNGLKTDKIYRHYECCECLCWYQLFSKIIALYWKENWVQKSCSKEILKKNYYWNVYNWVREGLFFRHKQSVRSQSSTNYEIWNRNENIKIMICCYSNT